MSVRVVVPPLLQLQVVLLVATLRKKPQRKKRKKRVCYFVFNVSHPLTTLTEKEESDEDMGFGLFD